MLDEQLVGALRVGLARHLALGRERVAEERGDEHERDDDGGDPEPDGPPGMERAGARERFGREPLSGRDVTQSLDKGVKNGAV